MSEPDQEEAKVEMVRPIKCEFEGSICAFIGHTKQGKVEKQDYKRLTN